MAFGRDFAETTGLRALGWLVANEDLIGVFLGSTGATLADLRNGAGNPAFLGSVLDFLLMDDAWVVACCDDLALPYESLMQARAALPGGAEINWT